MTVNLMDIARQFITPSMIQQLAGGLGENESATGNLVSGALPLVMGLLADKGSTVAGAQTLLDHIGPGKVGDPSMLDNLGQIASSFLGGQSTEAVPGAGGLLSMLLGGNAGLITNALSAFAGAGGASTGKVLGILAPMALSLIGRQAGPGATASGIMNLLGAQRGPIMDALPEGLRTALAGIPGLGFLNTPTPAPAYTPREAVAPAYVESAKKGSILPWILLGLGLLALLWYLFGRSKPTEPVATTPAPVEATAVPTEAEAMITATIPAGVTPIAPDPSMTAEMCTARFQQLLSGATIEFDTASAAIRDEYKPLLQALAQTAGRCSTYTITVEGHTDLEGSQAINLPLSRDRALAVANYLVEQGVNPAQLRAIGFGESRPKAAVGGAAQSNRRIELVVRQ